MRQSNSSSQSGKSQAVANAHKEAVNRQHHGLMASTPEARQLAQLKAIADKSQAKKMHEQSYVGIRNYGVIQRKTYIPNGFSQTGTGKVFFSRYGGTEWDAGPQISPNAPVSAPSKSKLMEELINKASHVGQFYDTKAKTYGWSKDVNEATKPNDNSVTPTNLKVTGQNTTTPAEGLEANYHFGESASGYVIGVQFQGDQKAEMTADDPNYSVAPAKVTSYSKTHRKTNNQKLIDLSAPQDATQSEDTNEQRMDSPTKILGEGARWNAVRDHRDNITDDTVFYVEGEYGNKTNPGIKFQHLWKCWKGEFSKAYGIPNLTLIHKIVEKAYTGGSFHGSSVFPVTECKNPGTSDFAVTAPQFVQELKNRWDALKNNVQAGNGDLSTISPKAPTNQLALSQEIAALIPLDQNVKAQQASGRETLLVDHKKSIKGADLSPAELLEMQNAAKTPADYQKKVQDLNQERKDLFAKFKPLTKELEKIESALRKDALTKLATQESNFDQLKNLIQQGKQELTQSILESEKVMDGISFRLNAKIVQDKRKEMKERNLQTPHQLHGNNHKVETLIKKMAEWDKITPIWLPEIQKLEAEFNSAWGKLSNLKDAIGPADKADMDYFESPGYSDSPSEYQLGLVLGSIKKLESIKKKFEQKLAGTRKELANLGVADPTHGNPNNFSLSGLEKVARAALDGEIKTRANQAKKQAEKEQKKKEKQKKESGMEGSKLQDPQDSIQDSSQSNANDSKPNTEGQEAAGSWTWGGVFHSLTGGLLKSGVPIAEKDKK